MTYTESYESCAINCRAVYERNTNNARTQDDLRVAKLTLKYCLKSCVNKSDRKKY